jgi:predicted DNA-binding protein
MCYVAIHHPTPHQRKALSQVRDTTLPPVRVETQLKERLTAYARKQDRDISWVIRKAVEEYLDRHDNEQ